VSSAPFSVLMVCMGNICRSPMAERLLAREVGDLVYVHSAGTGGWHVGSTMDPGAARQVRSRGGDCDRFAARKLDGGLIDGSDLILTATIEQVEYIADLRPDAAGRTFVFGEFGRLLRSADLSSLPPAAADQDTVHARGAALVEAVDKVRAGTRPTVADELDDPYGRGESYFSRVADEIEDVVLPLAAALLP